MVLNSDVIERAAWVGPEIQNSNEWLLHLNETELQEFLEVLCSLLHETGIYRTQKGEKSPLKSLRNYCINVLKNDNWGTEIIEYTNYYAMDGKMVKRNHKRMILIKTQEE